MKPVSISENIHVEKFSDEINGVILKWNQWSQSILKQMTLLVSIMIMNCWCCWWSILLLMVFIHSIPVVSWPHHTFRLIPHLQFPILTSRTVVWVQFWNFVPVHCLFWCRFSFSFVPFLRWRKIYVVGWQFDRSTLFVRYICLYCILSLPQFRAFTDLIHVDSFHCH